MPLKVLLIILAVLALLLYLPVGVDVGYTGGQVLLRVRTGALAFTVLPRKAGKKQSKKQKKYYRQAKRRVKAQSYRRLDSIFAMLEAKDPALKSISFS